MKKHNPTDHALPVPIICLIILLFGTSPYTQKWRTSICWAVFFSLCGIVGSAAGWFLSQVLFWLYSIITGGNSSFSAASTPLTWSKVSPILFIVTALIIVAVPLVNLLIDRKFYERLRRLGFLRVSSELRRAIKDVDNNLGLMN
jgi:hypothetical protein